MHKTSLLDRISQKGFDREIIAESAIKTPALLPELVQGLSADKTQSKYGCEKVLRVISERQPEILYSYFDVFVRLQHNLF